MDCGRANLVFIHVPKTGGSSISQSLVDYAVQPVGFTPNGNSLLSHKHAKATHYLNTYGRGWWNRQLSLAVVRNPWERMVSTFHFLQEVSPTHSFLFGASTVDEWVKSPKSNRRPAFSYVSYKAEIVVNNILRFENLEEEFGEFCHTHELTEATPLPRNNPSTHGPYREYFTRESRQIVEHTMERDITLWGYEF